MPMPSMRDALRGMGRRVTVQVIKQQVVDHEAVQAPRDLMRVTMVLAPMPAQKLAIKPEGQRKWRWWQGHSTAKLEVGWYIKLDRDGGVIYEVLERENWRQAGIYNYQLAESPR